MTVKTRFAPSPTGYLHVGGARTALYSWLHARQNGGQFVLRIEDTDRERSTEESVQAIFDGMKWLGLEHDEGPYYQSQRFPKYQEYIEKLLAEGKAYRCYCSSERLDALRDEQKANKQKPRYDGRCRNLSEYPVDKPHVIRFRNPEDGQVMFKDLVRGSIAVSNTELDDLIIARTDGTPTYNFTVVIDDFEMGITHVIRGDDHINNTPRQVNILRALGATPPQYGHVPMILGDDGKRLSKRHGAVSVMQYRDDGYLPQAVINYLVRLGWSHGDQEIFSLQELQTLFKITDVNRAPSAFNTEKLLWLNQHYIKSLPGNEVADHLKFHLENLGLNIDGGPDLLRVIDALRERAKTLIEMAQGCRLFYEEFEEFEEKAAKKHLRPVAAQPLEAVRELLTACQDWTAENIQAAINQTCEQLELGMGKVGMPLRVAATGVGNSPNLDITLELLGKDKTLARLEKALNYIAQRAA